MVIFIIYWLVLVVMWKTKLILLKDLLKGRVSICKTSSIDDGGHQ